MAYHKEMDWEGVYLGFFSLNKEPKKSGFHNKLVFVQS